MKNNYKFNKYLQYKKNINGIFLLDKPQGLSSNKSLQKIKRIFCAKKAGYIGTLDPLATGVLPIFFGEGTKLSNYFTDSIKSYHVIGKFGQVTSTYDSYGQILQNFDINFDDIELLNILKTFKGKIFQFPPIYSAIKYKGLPLYKYARKNIIIPKLKRIVFIYQLNCIRFNKKIIELKITCSKGTYIRTLIHDLGKLLKCGAHVIFLRRLKVSFYTILNTITFAQLSNLNKLYTGLKYYDVLYNLILPLKTVFLALPEIKYRSCTIFNKMNKICPFPFMSQGMIRITIKENKEMYVVGHIGNSGELMSYKLLNIS